LINQQHKQMLKKIETFYDDMFQYHYEKLRSKDSDPEVVPIAIISLCQITNILFLVILIYNLTEIKNMIDFKTLLYSFGFFYFIILGFNFYKIVLNNRRDFILKRNVNVDKKSKLIFRVYFIISFWLPFLLIYYFNEIY